MATATTILETDVYLEKFRRFEGAKDQPEWLMPLRRAGLARFGELGLPTVHHEDWRFTNTAAIARLPFNPVFHAAAKVAPPSLSQLPFAGQPGTRLVFVNGHFDASLSSASG